MSANTPPSLNLYDGSALTRINGTGFEARNNKQWRREYMSYQMELDKQFRNGREEERRNINKLNKALLSEKKYEELEKSTSDEEYQRELMKKYKIIE